MLGALARLGTESSRRTVLARAELAAEVLSGGKLCALELPWKQVSPDALAALRAWLLENRAPSTGRAVISSVQSILRQVWRDGHVSAERLERLRDLPPITGSSPPAGRRLKGPEIRALFEACPDTPTGRRDRVILALLLGCGLRRSEVVALDLQHVTDDDLVVANSKGGKSRTVPIPLGVRSALHTWLEIRGSNLRCEIMSRTAAGPSPTSGGFSDV